MKLIEENRQEFELTNVLTWQKDNLGEGITIVVLDQGDEVFNYMKPHVIIPFDDSSDEIEHGGAVVAVGYQIAPKARIILMPYLSNSKKTQIIDWIVEHKDEIDLINCSYVGATEKLEGRLKDLDIPIICASGNDGYTDRVRDPAKYDWTVAVGAYVAARDDVDYYSNGGPELDCVAPAWIAYHNNEGKEVKFTGTSCATPYVAFSLALYLSWRKRNGLPKLTRNEIKKIIHDNARDMYKEGHDYRSGYGLFRLPGAIPIIENGGAEMPDNSNDYFRDDDGKWYEQFANELAKKGVINGYEDGTVRGDDLIKRSEAMKMVAVGMQVVKQEILSELKK